VKKEGVNKGKSFISCAQYDHSLQRGKCNHFQWITLPLTPIHQTDISTFFSPNDELSDECNVDGGGRAIGRGGVGGGGGLGTGRSDGNGHSHMIDVDHSLLCPSPRQEVDPFDIYSGDHQTPVDNSGDVDVRGLGYFEDSYEDQHIPSTRDNSPSNERSFLELQQDRLNYFNHEKALAPRQGPGGLLGYGGSGYTGKRVYPNNKLLINIAAPFSCL
jgi:hypothetical protein